MQKPLRRRWILQTIFMVPVGIYFMLLPIVSGKDMNRTARMMVASVGAMILFVEAKLWQMRLTPAPTASLDDANQLQTDRDKTHDG